MKKSIYEIQLMKIDSQIALRQMYFWFWISQGNFEYANTHLDLIREMSDQKMEILDKLEESIKNPYFPDPRD